MVERFDPTWVNNNPDTEFAMRPWDDGEWVRFSDYEALEKRLRADNLRLQNEWDNCDEMLQATRAENERLTADLRRISEEHARIIEINKAHCKSVNSYIVSSARLEDRALAAEARAEKAAELQRAANALLNNLWQDVWSGKQTHEENWEAFDKQYPGVKWLHDELTALSTLESADAGGRS
jgi:hypothetical protein